MRQPRNPLVRQLQARAAARCAGVLIVALAVSIAVGGINAANADTNKPCRGLWGKAHCLDAVPPTSPTNLAITGSTATSINLSWHVATDNVGVAGYDVYLNGTRLGSTASTGYTFSGLRCGTSYTLGVDAYDTAGNRSAAVSVITATALCLDTIPPTVPVNLTVAGATQVTVSLVWSPSADFVGVAGYRVFKSGSLVATTIGTSQTISGLSCGTSYTFGVAAYDAAGNVSGQAILTAATIRCGDVTPPTTPGALATTGTTDDSISLGWSPSSDDVGVVGYRVSKDGALVATTSGTAQTISGLDCGTSYAFGVVAYDAAGNVSAQATVTAATRPCGGTLDVYSGGDISAAIAAAAPGTRIVIHSGTYPELLVTRQFASMTSVEAAPGASVTIQGIRLNGAAFLSFSGLNINSGSTSVEDVMLYGATHDIAITDNQITGGRFGIHVTPATGVAWPHDITVRDNEISAAYIDDMQIDGARNMVVQHNFIHDPQVNGQHNDGIQVVAADGLTIADNTIRFVHYNGLGGPNQGIILGRADPYDAARYVNNVLVSSNLVDHWEGTPILLAGVSNVSVVNNTAYDSGQGGTWSALNMTAKNDPSHFDNSGVEVWNNIFNRMTIGNGSSSPSYCGYNLVWPNGGNPCGQDLETTNPQFLDHTTYELEPTSPAVHSGSSRVGTPTVDLMGAEFGIPPDRGALGG